MAMLLQVKWVDQGDHSDVFHRVRHIGGASREFEWKHTHEQAVRFIEQGMFDYYVKVGKNAVRLEVGVSANGCKYLRTDTDDGQSLSSWANQDLPAR